MERRHWGKMESPGNLCSILCFLRPQRLPVDGHLTLQVAGHAHKKLIGGQLPGQRGGLAQPFAMSKGLCFSRTRVTMKHYALYIS